MANPVESLLKAVWRHGLGIADAAYISRRGFLGWRSALRCSSCSCLFFSNDLLRLRFQSFQYGLQHDFAWVADEADLSVGLALLQVAFLGRCDDQGLGPRGWPFSCLPHLVANCRESGDYVLSICWDVTNSSWLPFLQWLYCSLHFFAKDGVVVLCVCLGTVQYWWISVGVVIVSSEQYSVHRFRISRSPVRQFPKRSWIVVAFPCFTMVKSFTSWCALLLLFFIRFSTVSQHCSPIQFSFAFFMDLLMLFFTSWSVWQRRKLRKKWPRVFLLTLFAKDLTSCFSLCWGWWSLNPCLYLYYSWRWEVHSSLLL